MVTMLTRRRGRPRQHDVDERILSVTLKLLAQRGYARMSLEAVAAEAGVTKPTIYLRFPGKAALAQAALAALATSRRDTAPVDTGELRVDLIAHLRHFQRGVSRPYGVTLIGSVLAEEYETPELLALYRAHIVLPRREMLHAVLVRGREHGLIRPECDLDLAVNMLVGAFYAQYLEGRPFSEGWAEGLVDALLAGIVVHPS
jgi:AcrR family transcriptional regulator